MKYPLEQLAIIKQKKLEEAEKNLQATKKALEAELEKLALVEKERDQVKDHRMAKLTQLREELDRGTTSDKVQQMKRYLKVVDEKLKQKEVKVKQQLKLVDEAKAKVEAARQDLLKKQQDVEKLSIHRKEWEKEMKMVVEHMEAVESDELGSALDARKKMKEKKEKEKEKS